MSRYVLDHDAVARTHNPMLVVELIVDAQAEPEMARRLFSTGEWTWAEIADALWGELPPQSATEERIQARARAMEQLANRGEWRRESLCRPCEGWTAGRPRLYRPFAPLACGGQGACHGCIYSHLDDIEAERRAQVEAEGQELIDLLAEKQSELEQLMAMPTSERMMPDVRHREHRLRRYVQRLQEGCWPGKPPRR